MFALVLGSMLYSKYNIARYNRENNPSPLRKKKSQRTGVLCATVMILATIVYLTFGFLKNAWQLAPVIYAAAGLLCGVAAMVFGPKDED